MSGKASVFSPANQPIFDGRVVRNPTRVQQQIPYGPAGGGGDFPFQWSWPGTIAATAVAPEIYTASGFTPTKLYVTFITAPTPTGITLVVTYDGVTEVTLAGVTATGINAIAAAAAPPDTRIGLRVTNAGSGNGAGMWVGLTDLI